MSPLTVEKIVTLVQCWMIPDKSISKICQNFEKATEMMDSATHAAHADAERSLPVCSLIHLWLLLHLQAYCRHKSESHSLNLLGQKV